MTKYGKIECRQSFKVHNTINLETEQKVEKVLNEFKKLYLPSVIYGRLQKKYWDDVDKSLVYCFKDKKIQVRTRFKINLNGGTWYEIDSVRVNGEFVVCDENSYRPDLDLVESEN
jgi:hypothetical protein